MDIDHSSLRWFEAYSCKSAPRGLPSSLAQLHAMTDEKNYHLFAFVAHYAVTIAGFSIAELPVILQKSIARLANPIILLTK
jgi:hypothetical protein